MKVIAIEEHFITPSEGAALPPGAERGSDRERLLGIDIQAALLNLGEERIASMDAAGITMQVISHNQPGCQSRDGTAAIALARDANDTLHVAIQRHPDRFAGFAALPTADPSAAVKEFDRAITDLGFKGAMINGHTQGSFLDNKKYWGIFECAAAHRVPIYLHPREPHPAVMQAYFDGYREISLAAWGFAIDTGAHFCGWCLPACSTAFPTCGSFLAILAKAFLLWCIGSTTRRIKRRRGAASRRRRPNT